MGGGGSKQGGGRGAGEELGPVLLVSGIGGSILNARNKENGSQIRVWVRIFLANLEFKNKAWSLYDPSNGYTESLDPDTELVVPDDDYGLYAIDILDPSWFVKLLHLSDVYHFHDLIDMLTGCGYEKGTTLFGYGYDFRQSNRVDKLTDGLKDKLATAYKASGGRKVTIISHSMGGLLVRCFLSLYHDVFVKYVDKWICMACPFQGAPGCINDSLLTGLQFVYGFQSFFFVARWTMHQLLVECPSIYEMLPNPGFDWQHQPFIKIWRKESEGEDDQLVKLDTYEPAECYGIFKEALKDNELNYNGESVALPFNNAILDWAIKTRKILDDAQLPESVSFYNIYGTSYDSPFDVCYGTETSPISNLSDVCHETPAYSYVDGDGTVPSESAKADGFAAATRVAVKATHRGILKDETVFQTLKQWLGVSQVSKRSKASAKVMDTLSKTSEI